MSRPMSGCPPSTMQAMPSRLAMVSSSDIRSRSCMKNGAGRAPEAASQPRPAAPPPPPAPALPPPAAPGGGPFRARVRLRSRPIGS